MLPWCIWVMLYEQDTSHKSNNPSLKRLVEPNDTDIVKKYKQSSFVLGARTIVLTRAGQAEFKQAIMFCNILNIFQVFFAIHEQWIPLYLATSIRLWNFGLKIPQFWHIYRFSDILWYFGRKNKIASVSNICWLLFAVSIILRSKYMAFHIFPDRHM